MAQYGQLAAVRLIAFFSSLSPVLVLAQDCYYPNGDLDTSGTAECFPDGGACCPQKWACAANGLCYYEPDDLWGRYTCTSQSWPETSACPQYCTYNHTAPGGESVKQCDDGHWCCNGDGVHMDCCTMDHAQLINSTDFSLLTTIGVQESPSSVATSSSTESIMQSQTRSSTSDTSLSGLSVVTTAITTTSAATPVLFTTQTATTTDTAGIVTTIVIIQTSSPSSSPIEAAASTNPSSTGIIVGIVVGIAVILFAFAGLIYILYRRRKRNKGHSVHEKQNPPIDTMDMYANNKSPANTAEIDSFPIAVPLSGSKTGHQSGVSELSASNYPPQHTINGTSRPQSLGITSTANKNDLPEYSPVSFLSNSNQQGIRLSGIGDSGHHSLSRVQEEESSGRDIEPVELWGSLPPIAQAQTTVSAPTQDQVTVSRAAKPLPHPPSRIAGSGLTNPRHTYTAYHPSSCAPANDRPELAQESYSTPEHLLPTTYTPYRLSQAALSTAPPTPPKNNAETTKALSSPAPDNIDHGTLGTGLRVVNN